MPARVRKESKVLSQMCELFFAVKKQRNKDWARLVPAAAVIPAVQVAATFIRSKTFVACPASSL